MQYFLRKAYSFGRNHWFILMNAVAMALLVSAPVILYPFADRASYRGINAGNFAIDEFQYMAKGREILEGHGLGNFILREGKEWYNVQQSYVEYALMAPIQLFGLSRAVDVAIVFHVYGFLGVALLVVLIYFLVLQLSGDKSLASLIALFVVGGYALVTAYPLQTSAFSDNLNMYGRPVIPVWSSAALFLYLNALVKALRSRARRHTLLAGGSLGLLFYVYFYSWTYALALTGVLLMIYFVKKDFFAAKKLAAVTGIGILAGSYVLVQLILIQNSDSGRQIFSFFATGYGRTGTFSRVALVASLLFAAFLYRNRDDKSWPMLLAVVSANWISLNQQLVTGRTMEQWNYFRYFVIPMSIVVSLYAVWFLTPKGFARKLLFIALCAILYANTVSAQYRGFLDTIPAKRYAQNYRPIIDYLNEDAEQAVILSSDPFYQYLFVVYTPHDLFWAYTAPAFNTSVDRMKDALYVYAYLGKGSRENFSDFLDAAAKPHDVDSRTYTVRQYVAVEEIYYFLENLAFNATYGRNDSVAYERKWLSNDPTVLQLRENLLAKLSGEYKEKFRDRNGLLNVLKGYHVRYIVWDREMSPGWDLSAFGELEKVASRNSVDLYRLAY